MPKHDPSPSPEPSVKCHLCDHDTSAKPGHIVKDGKVVKCPFIDIDITRQMGRPADDPPVLR